MATLVDSLVSSTARPLTMRMRPDLDVRQVRYHGTPYWVIKDPVGLNYFRFQEEEFAILEWLDGHTSLDEIKRRFEKQFAPQKIGLDELGRLIGTLHRSGLVIADVPGQGPQLLKRRKQNTRRQTIGKFTNILAIRFKGIDPERILNWMLPYTRWFFTPWAATVCILFGLSALMLVAVQFDVFRSKLPTFHQFFAAENWIWLMLAMGITKIIHEFGHGLSCKYFGGECHEMGLMFLVFTPCLYCNVSDSWMLPSKWQRAFIGAAGMYVELVIASVATYLWWFSEPGMLNQLALSTMFVCSVSTVLFNANPLMRYDGYYILSDLTEIPNLRQKAGAILHRKLGKWCLGLKEPDDPFLPERNQAFFAVYSVASAVYLWVITFSILYFLYKVFEPYRLQIIGQMLVSLSLVSLVGMPLYKLFRFFHVPGRVDQVKRPRLFATLVVLAVVAAAILLVPLPYRIICPLEIKASNAESVYVVVEGDLAKVNVKPGDYVAAGQTLAQLVNQDLDLRIAELIAKRDLLVVELSTLREQDRVPGGSGAGLQIDSVKDSLEAINKQLELMKADRARLTLVANVGGTVIAAPSEMPKPHQDLQLDSWTGSTMDPKNLGATLPSGRMFCQIGDPTRMDAAMVVEQGEMDFIQPEQVVEIKLDVLPGATFESKINELSYEKLLYAPKRLSNKAEGEIETVTDETGAERPINTLYQAEAWIVDDAGVVRPGMVGRAKIHAGYQTLGQRFWRFVTRTFNFKL
ncbi:MAG: efflux RND transporter periplasmic adaptor subunit [Pirellulales bacterium]